MVCNPEVPCRALLVTELGKDQVYPFYSGTHTAHERALVWGSTSVSTLVVSTEESDTER